MFCFHLVILVISLCGAVIFRFVCRGTRALREMLLYVPMFIIVAAVNPLFSHRGESALFFLNGNPVTSEAIYYGISLAVMLFAVMLWFRSFSAVFTSDKLMFVFGRVIPKTGIVLSSALRFIPWFTRQYKQVSQTQKALGVYSDINYTNRIKSNLRVFSVMVTWSLENAVDTADSMRARGYELPGHKTFSRYYFKIYDAIFAAAAGLCVLLAVYSITSGILAYNYYPTYDALTLSPAAAVCFAAFGLLVLLPVIYEIKEKIVWKYCASKI